MSNTSNRSNIFNTSLSHSAPHTAQNLPAMQETRVRSLGQEDPLEEETATHSSLLAWSISWMEEPGGLQSTGSQRVNTTDPVNFGLVLVS